MRWYFKLLIALAFIALFGLLIMLLWNALLPDLFGLKKIGFFQALGIFILSHILFGGHHPTHHSREQKLFHERFHKKLDRIRNSFYRRCETKERDET
jgi:hypothetical protein